ECCLGQGTACAGAGVHAVLRLDRAVLEGTNPGPFISGARCRLSDVGCPHARRRSTSVVAVDALGGRSEHWSLRRRRECCSRYRVISAGVLPSGAWCSRWWLSPLRGTRNAQNTD